MKLYREILVAFACCCFLSNCSISIREVEGTYILTKSDYILDTLILYNDFVYKNVLNSRESFRFKQKFYNKKTGEFMFENEGKWWINGSRIEFLNFYFNNDSDPEVQSYSPEAIKVALATFSTEIEDRKILLNKTMYYKKVKSNK
jgi:hypothetical protein